MYSKGGSGHAMFLVYGSVQVACNYVDNPIACACIGEEHSPWELFCMRIHIRYYLYALQFTDVSQSSAPAQERGAQDHFGHEVNSVTMLHSNFQCPSDVLTTAKTGMVRLTSRAFKVC